MYDEEEARQLCIRAIEQYNKASSNITSQERDSGEKAIVLLKQEMPAQNPLLPTLCNALAFYLKSLKAIESFMISDPLFRGFDGSNPLLRALDREINLALETKAQICHEDIPVRHQSRIDW